jgi:hypothetical protein
MKIKSDFVTNSSSTSYVVFIPDRFYVDDGEALEYFKAEIEMYYDADDSEIPIEERLEKDIPDFIESLKEGENLWREGDLNYAIWDVLLGICEKHNFILTHMDVSCEGNNVIYGVREEVIENILINSMDLMSMFKNLKGGQCVTPKIE